MTAKIQSVFGGLSQSPTKTPCRQLSKGWDICGVKQLFGLKWEGALAPAEPRI